MAVPFRSTITIETRIECYAPDEIFTIENYDDIPADLRAQIEEMHGLACDGGGVPGKWCIAKRCLWHKATEEEIPWS
jgi:hypothetical protein